MNLEHRVRSSVLLSKLNIHINKKQVYRCIRMLTDEVVQEESATGFSKRTQALRNKIARLKDQVG